MSEASQQVDQAADLLIFYMRRVWEAAGLGWEPDNSAEMRNLVDHIAAAAEDDTRVVLSKHLQSAHGGIS